MAKTAEVAFSSADRVRYVIHDFDADGRETKKIAKSRPAEHGLPFPAWSLTRLVVLLVAEGARRHIRRAGGGRRLSCTGSPA